ncbi:MAG: oligosaccharide flippase family protein [bacterium]
MKAVLIRFVERAHILFFDRPMSDQMRTFLSDLSWSFYSSMVALPSFMVIGTLAARFMGPAVFGKYNLIVIISSYVTVVAFSGLDISAVKAIVKSRNEHQKRESFFSAFVYVVSVLVFFSILAVVLRPFLEARYGLSSALIWFTILYTLVISVRALFDILIRALEMFKFQVIGKVAEVLTLATGFLLVVLITRGLSYQAYILLTVGSMTVASAYYCYFLRGYFNGFSLAVLKKQLTEGKFFMISALLATIFASSDRLIIARYVDITTVGIYSAYYLASLGIVGALSGLFTNVFLPATAKLTDKTFTKKLDHFLVKGFIPLFVIICVLIMVFLAIFGKAYPFRWDYVVMFALAATLTFFQNLQNTVILDTTMKRYAYYAYVNNFINLLTVVYYLILVRYVISVDLILLGYLVNMLATMLVQRKLIGEMRDTTKTEGGV